MTSGDDGNNDTDDELMTMGDNDVIMMMRTLMKVMVL